MESRLKERMINFAVSIEDTPEWRMSVWRTGIHVSYSWLNAQGKLHLEEQLVTWVDMENSNTHVNPLELAKVSLTKIAGSHQ